MRASELLDRVFAFFLIKRIRFASFPFACMPPPLPFRLSVWSFLAEPFQFPLCSHSHDFREETFTITLQSRRSYLLQGRADLFLGGNACLPMHQVSETSFLGSRDGKNEAPEGRRAPPPPPPRSLRWQVLVFQQLPTASGTAAMFVLP